MGVAEQGWGNQCIPEPATVVEAGGGRGLSQPFMSVMHHRRVRIFLRPWGSRGIGTSAAGKVQVNRVTELPCDPPECKQERRGIL